MKRAIAHLIHPATLLELAALALFIILIAVLAALTMGA